MLDFVRKRASWKRVFFLLFLSQIVFLCMMFVTVPVIHQGSSGLRMFDLAGVSDYDVSYADTFVQGLAERGRTTYLYVQQPLDVLFPFLSSACFVMSFCLLCDRQSHWPLLGWAPMVFDYLENIFVIVMLTSRPIPSLVPSIASVMSQLKATATILCFAFLAALVFRKFILRKKAKASS
jgi:hypothetical protein